MNLTVNNQPVTTEATTLAGLLEETLGRLPDAGVAVAVDGDVVPRSQWDHSLVEGQTIDILTAVQGG
ncbi:sulfur carrier protein ThiS [Corynebacterium sp. YIM 101645]|uniref:Sulfur carrier protein ThiS n=1 Tax=Corynebacterium lemuris TaxID=1859292 RepID=A0ABT2FVJ5_9CORY|nr:sulfur carrier protein ThiS [Corynebacterium lemuris]MCS5479263.1 sulfur carrier protein ThiS [Corynebacterium lemuris]